MRPAFLLILLAAGCQSASTASKPAPAKCDQCQMPSRTTLNAQFTAPATTQSAAHADMILVPGGTFLMGTDDGKPVEGPVREASVKPFYLDRHEVTVAQFTEFVKATNYKTESETIGSSGVFDIDQKRWLDKPGISWRFPESLDTPAKPNEPVVHISWNDAQAYAKWAGKRLPTEAEFEFANRGGLVQKTYAWGDELRPNGKLLANIWQGQFPYENKQEDGYAYRAAVESFPPNGFGLYDLTGNVWEWCADVVDPAQPTQRVIRGGSFLCAENYCTNYRVTGRSFTSADTGLNNVGFRCAKDAQ